MSNELHLGNIITYSPADNAVLLCKAKNENSLRNIFENLMRKILTAIATRLLATIFLSAGFLLRLQEESATLS